MDSQNGGKFKPAYAKRPHDFPTCMQLNQPHCVSAEHVNLHDFHASISYLPQLISLQAPVSESLLMHPHDVLATKTQISALDPEIRSVIHSYPTVVRQFNEAHGFPSLPESFRELLLETRSDLEYLQQSDPAALMTGMQHFAEGLSTDWGPANQVAGDLNGSMIRGTSNILGLEDDHERSVGDNYKSNIAAIRSLSMRSNSSTDPRLSTDYSNNGGSNQELIINSNKEEVDLIKGQMGINNGNTNNKDGVDYEKISNAGSATIYFGQAPPLDADSYIVEQPISNNSKRRLSSASIITPPKRAQLECMSYQSAGAMWDNNINGFNGAMQQPASRAKRSSRNPLGPALNTNLKPRARQGSANDPQSIAARQRRERINMRLKALQELVPNGSKFDLVTMLEKAINYVKFLQLQLKVLTDDEFWRNAHHLSSLNNDHNKEEEYSSLESSNVESKNPVN